LLPSSPRASQKSARRFLIRAVSLIASPPIAEKMMPLSHHAAESQQGACYQRALPDVAQLSGCPLLIRWKENRHPS
jgi:hypothetical protein